MRSWISGHVVVGCILALTGCATTPRLRELVGDQMSRDFGCPETEVDVVEVGEERFGATGCGESLAYVVHCEGHSTSSCVAIREYQHGTP